MKNISLDRPRSEPFRLDSLLYRNRYILMPGNLPICISNLVEENAPHRKKVWPENWFDQGSNSRGIGKCAHLCRYIQQIAYREDTPTLSHSPSLIDMIDRSQELDDIFYE